MNQKQTLWQEQLSQVYHSQLPAAYASIERRLEQAELEPAELVLARLAIGNYEVKDAQGNVSAGKPMDIDEASKLSGLRVSRASARRVTQALSEVMPQVVRCFGSHRSNEPAGVPGVVGTYLSKPEMQLPLLTAEEEQELIMKVAIGRELQEVENPNLSQRATLEAAREARDTLVTRNLKLAVHVAKRYGSDRRDFPDLLQAANEGLLYAAAHAQPHKGAKFSSYAVPCIEGYIKDSFAGLEAGGINLGEHYFPTRRFMQYERSLAEVLGRTPTEQELIDSDPKRELDETAVRKFKRNAALIRPLDIAAYEIDVAMTPLEEQNPDNRSRTPPSTTHRPLPEEEVSEQVAQAMLRHQLEEVLGTLSEREATVITMRYGLDGAKQPATRAEIGKIFGVQGERIRQIESKTMDKLRHPLRSKMLRDYLS